MVTNGANVNHVNNTGRSVLDLTSNEEIKTYLVSNGAQTSAQLLK